MARREEILTSAEARRYLKIGRTKLWQLTKEQVIPCYRLGSSRNATIRYKRSELLKWLEKHRFVPTGPMAGNGQGDGH
ncbi:MAG TPA: helix-turn-helix domain-containing protein [Candidatus Polarisedimenticolia bacterium]|nr:helix-turn-helix domain-containing protein [Candidatus Polarisedimenticolia bacterium]